MLRLEFTNQTGTFEHFNPRTEKDGQDKVPAADLKISCPMPPDVLAHFRPDLKHTLFVVDKDLAGEVLRVRDPHIQYPIARDEEMTGATVSIDFGIGDPMVFDDAKVNSFRITPSDGGTVYLQFRVQCRPTQDEGGKLYWLQEKGITFSLEPGELPEVAKAAA
jgi:hypothetical protein